MREYKVINQHELKQSTRIFALIAGIALIVLGGSISSIYTGIVGVIIILAVIYKKQICFNEDGYLTVYDFILLHHHNLWSYAEISYMHREVSPNRNYLGILVQKGMVFKRAVVPIEMAEEILSLAKEKNPNIYIGDADKQ
ncbi:MAG: hypothetical protein PHX63_06065 [Eubacteriales bacterium]|nr:hypothetical protein [Eubacteriales bacterium]